MKEHIDKEVFVKELQRVDELVDGPVTARQFDRYTDHSKTTLQRRFGTFNNAKREAEIETYSDLTTSPEYRRRRLDQIKENEGCEICGYNRCTAALEFHHSSKENKEITIGRAVTNRGWEGLLEEIRKCIVLCANCHREIENEYTTE